MAKTTSSLLCLALVLLCSAPAADALCYWSPITFVRTCTSWTFPSPPSYSTPPSAPSPSTYGNPGRTWGPWYKNLTPSPYVATAAPTKAPTPAPYYEPTAAPTKAPTPAPYYEPTAAPTKAPTPAPYYPTPAATTASAPYNSGSATPAPTRGCFGSLPFGLENCVCDGAVAGEAAGLAACSAVYSQCATIQQFSVDVGKQLGAVQRACDSLASSSCSMTAKQLAMSHPVCASLLAGEGSCSSEEAMALLDASVKDSCDPLCPDCGSVDGPEPTELPEAASASATTTSAYDEPAVDYPTATEAAGDSYGASRDGSNGYPTATTAMAYEQPAATDDAPYSSTTQQPEVTTDKPADQQPQQQQGCFGDLPMGLEQCVCDGATIGEAAGLAACSAVFAECMDLMPFSVTDAAPPTERSCDSLAQSACVDTGMQLALAHQPCAQMLFQEGFSSKCSPEKAREIFQGQMQDICAPLCPDCPRLPF